MDGRPKMFIEKKYITLKELETLDISHIISQPYIISLKIIKQEERVYIEILFNLNEHECPIISVTSI